tara:strand:+ start:172 stop:315 length:144 start_codon:yes stop_codon:yes gene_type:complete
MDALDTVSEFIRSFWYAGREGGGVLFASDPVRTEGFEDFMKGQANGL